MSSTLTPDERDRIWTAARNHADQVHLTNDQMPVGVQAVPDTDPNWDYQIGQTARSLAERLPPSGNRLFLGFSTRRTSQPGGPIARTSQSHGRLTWPGLKDPHHPHQAQGNAAGSGVDRSLSHLSRIGKHRCPHPCCTYHPAVWTADYHPVRQRPGLHCPNSPAGRHLSHHRLETPYTLSSSIIGYSGKGPWHPEGSTN
ncbi:uncharacterized protein [Saccopteryx leptura]|uniref:uncharacterized protein isoform X1 n=1 Tax=Saccopteryx leptura TaxID=249018 RepID=UPI00339CCC45